MLPKPAIGEACNRCGLCCQVKVCGAGSYLLGLVETYGERAAGPCPALVPRADGGLDCGVVLRPKDHIRSQRGVTALRNAFALLVGAGAGCDEAGDEPDGTALPKLRKLQEEFARAHGEAEIRRALRTVYGDG